MCETPCTFKAAVSPRFSLDIPGNYKPFDKIPSGLPVCKWCQHPELLCVAEQSVEDMQQYLLSVRQLYNQDDYTSFKRSLITSIEFIILEGTQKT